MTEWLGWVATAVVVASYFCRRADTMRRVQMTGALVWAVYGTIIAAYPIVVANLLVIGAAAWATARESRLTSLPDA